MADSETLDFLVQRGKTAKLVTSVCTGSMVLGAAGLLRGYKATSHWSVRDILPHLGAELAVNRGERPQPHHCRRHHGGD